MRGASVLENRRSAIEPCMAAIQQVGQCPNARRDPRPRVRAVEQQKLCPLQAPEADQVVDVKGNIQRRMFTQPPGYVAPPPYNSPSYQASDVMPHGLTQVEKIQEKQDRKQNTCSDLEGYSYQKNPVQIVHIPQTDLTTSIIRESSSKVIEGRTFRLNKRTGGMTIFCLVSRIAGPTENPSLTPSEQAPKTGANCSSISNENIETAKVADEVDNGPLALVCTEQDRNVQHIEVTESCLERKLPEEGPPKKDEAEDCLFKESKNKALSTLEKQATQSTLPVPARYPLWREPSFTSKIHNRSQLGMEVRRLDVKKSSETEEGKNLLVIDTTCVVVKMEVIKSPMTEQVHIIGTTVNTEQSPQHSSASSDRSSSLSTELHSDQSSELNLLPINEHPANGLNSDPAETTATNAPENAEIESLEKRAERILGIDIQASSLLDMCVKDTEKRSHLPQVNDNKMNGPLSKDTADEKCSQNQQNQSIESISAEDKNPKVDCDNLSGSHQKVFHFLDDTKLNNVCEFDKTENSSNDSTQEEAKLEQISSEIANQNLTPPPFCCNNSLPEANQDPERESSPNYVLSPLAVQSLTVFESETTDVSDNDSVIPNPIQECSTQLEAVTLLPSLLDSDEPSTLPLSPDKKTSTAMADIEVCEEDEAEKEKASQQGKLSDVACDSPVDGTDGLAAHQQLQSEAANEAIPGRSHDKPTALNSEQPFLIQAKDRNETNNSGNSEKVMDIQSEAKVETLANLAQDVHTKKVNAESDDDKDFPGLKEHTQECQSDILPTTKPFIPEKLREALPKTSSPPFGSREDIAPQPERESACPSSHGPPVGPLETLPALLLDHTPSENSPSFSPPTPPLPEESENLPPELPQGAELQYPTSLWDAVNRIRKHTAPDSENEEDEVFELWDPDNVAVNLDHGVFEEPELLEVTQAEETLPQPFHEEDTLSCSSASSHNSGDTVIIADEDYVEETEDEGASCCVVETEGNNAGEM
ncbi:uncharacterized protein LOC144075362 isoform X2 [Stigmatopora argus]